MVVADHHTAPPDSNTNLDLIYTQIISLVGIGRGEIICLCERISFPSPLAFKTPNSCIISLIVSLVRRGFFSRYSFFGCSFVKGSRKDRVGYAKKARQCTTRTPPGDSLVIFRYLHTKVRQANALSDE